MNLLSGGPLTFARPPKILSGRRLFKHSIRGGREIDHLRDAFVSSKRVQPQILQRFPTGKIMIRDKMTSTLIITGGLLATATLAGTAIATRQMAKAAEITHPPEGRFMMVDGVRLHFVDSGGDGSPVVLLHGNGTMIADMEISGLIERASRRYRTIAFDRPGFGYSSRPRDAAWTPSAQAMLFRKAFTQLGIEKPIIVAHSWGTLVALGLALEQDAAGGLVLVSGYYYPTARADVALLSTPAIPLLGDSMRHTVSPLLGRMLAPHMIRKSFAPAEVTPEFKSHFPLDMSLRPSQIRASAEETALMTSAAAKFQNRYSSVNLPVFIIAGAGDRIVNVDKQSRRLARDIPGSTLLILPGLGHMLHHSAPDEVMAAVETISHRISETRRLAG
jgi:pimeloyl-ACP methyl ester carboxylesterase